MKKFIFLVLIFSCGLVTAQEAAPASKNTAEEKVREILLSGEVNFKMAGRRLSETIDPETLVYQRKMGKNSFSGRYEIRDGALVEDQDDGFNFVFTIEEVGDDYFIVKCRGVKRTYTIKKE